jgi:hypothetical protein
MRKILYRFFFVFLFIGGTGNQLFGQAPIRSVSEQDINQPSRNYSFFSENTGKSGTPLSNKGSSFFDKYSNWSRKKKTIVLNVGSVVTAGTIGAASWDYYSSSFSFLNEGWFDPDTKYGGADKIGHAWGGYALTAIYDNIYKKFGYKNEDAIALGALSSWGLLTLIEVGDGFSQEYGFSVQDETMNTLGVGIGYLHERFPALKEIFDFRLEWVPSRSFRNGDSDPFTDYSGQKNILALKPAGILHSDNELLKMIEIDFGFYTRGYGEVPEYYSKEHRHIFLGVGFNITYILEQLTGWRAGGIFDYIQVPFTYFPVTLH